MKAKIPMDDAYSGTTSYEERCICDALRIESYQLTAQDLLFEKGKVTKADLNNLFGIGDDDSDED